MPFPLDNLAELLLAALALLTSTGLAALLSHQLDPESTPRRRR